MLEMLREMLHESSQFESWISVNRVFHSRLFSHDSFPNCSRFILKKWVKQNALKIDSRANPMPLSKSYLPRPRTATSWWEWLQYPPPVKHGVCCGIVKMGPQHTRQVNSSNVLKDHLPTIKSKAYTISQPVVGNPSNNRVHKQCKVPVLSEIHLYPIPLRKGVVPLRIMYVYMYLRW